MMLGPSCALIVMLVIGTHLTHRFMSLAWSAALPSPLCAPAMDTSPFLMTMVNVHGASSRTRARSCRTLGGMAQNGSVSRAMLSNSSMRMTSFVWANLNLTCRRVGERDETRVSDSAAKRPAAKLREQTRLGEGGREEDAPVVEPFGGIPLVPPLVLDDGFLEGLALPRELLLPLHGRVRDEVVDRVVNGA